MDYIVTTSEGHRYGCTVKHADLVDEERRSLLQLGLQQPDKADTYSALNVSPMGPPISIEPARAQRPQGLPHWGTILTFRFFVPVDPEAVGRALEGLIGSTVPLVDQGMRFLVLNADTTAQSASTEPEL